MPNILNEICDAKRSELAKRKRVISEGTLRQAMQTVTPPRGFLDALKAKADNRKIALIAEIKKASPSQGVIRADFDPAAHARAYDAGGAACLSVLTDTPYFQGRNSHLSMARAASKLPILRKDFILDPFQLLEARSLGADCVLLILAALSESVAKSLEQLALGLGMDVLLEVHSRDELKRALSMQSKLIGINNRDLQTMKVDLSRSATLCPLIPDNYTVVCESGIRTNDDILRMQRNNIHCFLVGETLMRQPDIEAATKTLLGIS